jgi:hypothetical protein
MIQNAHTKVSSLKRTSIHNAPNAEKSRCGP